MKLEQKKQVAIFRFGVISDLVGRVCLERGELERLIKEKSNKRWDIPFSDKSRISESTIRRWIKVYKEQNKKLEALYPKGREDKGYSRVIDSETGASLVQLRKEMPILPISMLIDEMQKRKLVSSEVRLYTSTVYRFLHEHGVLTGPSLKIDRRRFEAELPNDIWQSDVMHGPQVMFKGKKRKTYLIAFLDDHSRLIPHGEFFFSENLESFLKAFKIALLKRGLPRKLYVDNGPAFRSKHLEHLTASLGIALVHSRPYTPQGRGKIERFFRSVRSQMLSCINPATLDALNNSCELWLEDIYHQKQHSSTGETPMKRYSRHVHLLRAAPKDLEDHFRVCVRRRVTKDRAVSLDGRLYEAPVALISEQVELFYHKDKPESVEIKHKGKSYGFLNLLDLKVNCRVRRDPDGIEISIDDSNPTPKGGSLPFGSKKEGRL